MKYAILDGMVPTWRSRWHYLEYCNSACTKISYWMGNYPILLAIGLVLCIGTSFGLTQICDHIYMHKPTTWCKSREIVNTFTIIPIHL